MVFVELKTENLRIRAVHANHFCGTMDKTKENPFKKNEQVRSTKAFLNDSKLHAIIKCNVSS
jgi:hypothetical protein